MFVIKVPKTLSTDARFCKYLLALLIEKVGKELKDSDYTMINPAVVKFLGIDNPPSCSSMLSYYIRTFDIVNKDDYISVGDNKMTEYVLGTSRTLYEVVRLMEYGVNDHPPVPKLSKVINFIQENLSQIYKKWSELR